MLVASTATLGTSVESIRAARRYLDQLIEPRPVVKDKRPEPTTSSTVAR